MTTASSYIGKNLHIFSYIRKPFLIYDIAPHPIWISLYVYEESFVFFFISVLTVFACEQPFSHCYCTVLPATDFAQYFRDCLCSLCFRYQLKIYTSGRSSALYFRFCFHSICSVANFRSVLQVSTGHKIHIHVYVPRVPQCLLPSPNWDPPPPPP